jgi:hypothetical protein
MTRDEIAELFWREDGPTYSGWPNIGERVHWEYRDQHPRAKERVYRLADAILKVINKNQRR